MQVEQFSRREQMSRNRGYLRLVAFCHLCR